jgi:hypothetical protein
MCSTTSANAAMPGKFNGRWHYGTKFAGGRGSVVAAFSYTKQDRCRATQRAVLQ